MPKGGWGVNAKFEPREWVVKWIMLGSCQVFMGGGAQMLDFWVSVAV